MSEKSVDAFRTISEVAEDLKLPQHVLRFWETRFNQIKPMKRGGGRRYYKPDDVELLRGIRYLLYVKGFTIKGVQRILKENGPRFVVAVGSGDTEALEAMQAGRAPVQATRDIGGSSDGGASERLENDPRLDDLDLIAGDGFVPAGATDGAALNDRDDRLVFDTAEQDVVVRGDRLSGASDAVVTPQPEGHQAAGVGAGVAVGQSQGQRARPLSGFLKRHREVPVEPSGERVLSRQSVEALDTVILELLECKRLLDQVR